jgi:hypothetical protein
MFSITLVFALIVTLQPNLFPRFLGMKSPQEMPAAFITSRMDCVLVVDVGNSMH